MRNLLLLVFALQVNHAGFAQTPWRLDTTFMPQGVVGSAVTLRQGGPTGLYLFGSFNQVNGQAVGNAVTLDRAGSVVTNKAYPPGGDLQIVGNMEFSQYTSYSIIKYVNDSIDNRYAQGTNMYASSTGGFGVFLNGELLSFGQYRIWGGRQNNFYWLTANGKVDSSRTQFDIGYSILPIYTDRKGNILARTVPPGAGGDGALVRIHPSGRTDALHYATGLAYLGVPYYHSLSWLYSPFGHPMPAPITENSDGSYLLTGLFNYGMGVKSIILKVDSGFVPLPDSLQPESVTIFSELDAITAIPDNGGAVAGIDNDTWSSGVFHTVYFLRPDMSIDSTAPILKPNGFLSALATHRDTVYVYGNFTTLGPGMARNRIARFVRTSSITAAAPKVALALQVWPNPAQGRFSVQIPSTLKDSTLRITDLMGRPVQVLPVHQARIEVSGLPSGVYLVSAPGCKPVRVVVQ